MLTLASNSGIKKFFRKILVSNNLYLKSDYLPELFSALRRICVAVDADAPAKEHVVRLC